MEYRSVRRGAERSLVRAEQCGLPEWAVKYCRELIAKADRHHAQSIAKGISADLKKAAIAGRAEDILAVTSLIGGYYRHQPIEDVIASGISFRIGEQHKHLVANGVLVSGSSAEENRSHVAELRSRGYGGKGK